MSEKMTLLDLFPDLERGDQDDALLQHSTVEDFDLRVKEREITVVLRCEAYLSVALLGRFEHRICEAYDLRRLTLEPRYALALLAQMDYSDVTGLLSGFYPPAPAALALCRWEVEGSTLHAHLHGNGFFRKLQDGRVRIIRILHERMDFKRHL